MRMTSLLNVNKFFNLPQSHGLFSIGHFVQIGVMIAILVASFFVFRGKKHWETPLFICLAVLSNSFLIALFVFSVKTGIYNPEWYVPAHICNLFAIIFPLMAIFKNKVRTFLYDYTFYFGILGCIFAICLPATTQNYFEPFHFVSVIVYLYHTLIGVAGVYVVASGKFVPKVSTFWRLATVFLPLCVVALVLNYYWDTNFVFLNTQKTYYPLDLFSTWFGPYFVYVLVAAILTMSAIMFCVSLAVYYAKNILVSKILAQSWLIKYIKEKNLFDYVIKSEFIQAIMQNQNISDFVQSVAKLIDVQTFKQCYLSVEQDLKQLTVGQLEDLYYMFNLIKKSNVIAQVLKTVKFKNLKQFVNLMKSAPYTDFTSIANQFLEQYVENKKQKALPQLA